MAYRNNIYGNAAFVGFFSGMLMAQRQLASSTAADYLALRGAAIAMAIDVDALIPFDALVTTGSAITQLAVTTNVIAANEQHRASLLQAICMSAGRNAFTLDSAVAGDLTAQAAAVVAAWTEAIAALVTP